MARIPYPDLAKASAEVREMLGRLPVPANIFNMMAHAETCVKPMMKLGGTLLGKLQLDPKLRELCLLHAVKLVGGEYEWVQHVPIAQAVGASDDQVAALERDDPDADCFSGDQRAVLRFTAEVVRDAQASDAALEQLTGFLSPQEIVELLMVIGQYMMVARVMATTRMEIDEPAGPGALSAAR